MPTLPYPSERVDPDAWLVHYHRRFFRRKSSRNGVISVGNHDYYIGYQFGGKHITVFLDAPRCVFKILYQGSMICEREIQGIIGHDMPFGDYPCHMPEAARTETV